MTDELYRVVWQDGTNAGAFEGEILQANAQSLAAELNKTTTERTYTVEPVVRHTGRTAGSENAPGPGRPPLSQTEQSERHNVIMQASLWEYAKNIGNGNVSQGIRTIVTDAMIADRG